MLNKNFKTGRFEKGHMPTNGFKKGQKPTKPFKDGHIPWNKQEKIIKICLICGKEYIVQLNRKNKSKYCSMKCLGLANRKHKHSEETKKKISNSSKNKIVSKDTKEKMQLASSKRWENKEYRKKFQKENHFNWKGGISFEPYSLDWTNSLKISIRERDKYTCSLCNEKQNETTFVVHHIDYNKKNCNPNNLITLCVKCHIKTNYNRDKWVEYFKQKMSIWQH